MYVTLTILFLILLLLFVFYGWGLIIRRSGQRDDESGEKCSLCRQRFPLESLVEREIGDYKLLHFCTGCIDELSRDAKNLPTHNYQ